MVNERLMLRWYNIISQSGLFDNNYYINSYKDVIESKIDPIVHYLKYGVTQRRNPSKNFDTELYLKNNPKLLGLGTNPLIHYILLNQPEIYAELSNLGSSLQSKSLDILDKEADILNVLRDGAFFSTFYYLDQFDEKPETDDLILHFYKHGWKDNKNPIEWFDTETYVRNAKDVLDAGFNPYLHFLEYGYQNNREFSTYISLDEAKIILNDSENKWDYFNKLGELIHGTKIVNELEIKRSSKNEYSNYIIKGEEINGRIESTNNGEVRGWVVNEKNSNENLSFILNIDDKYYFYSENNLNRNDLKKKGISNGVGGFKIKTDIDIIKVNKLKFLNLRNTNQRQEFNKVFSEARVEAKKPKSTHSDSSNLILHHETVKNNRLKFKIESFESKILKGWLVALDDKSKVISFDLFVNDVLFCNVKTNTSRSDLKRHGLSSGLGGFQVVFPQAAINLIFDKKVNKVSGRINSQVLFEYNIEGTNHKSNNLIRTYCEFSNETSIIVPIYNAYDDVKICIERLEKYTPKGTEVLLINDASPDSRITTLLDTIDSKILNFKVIHNLKNLGFTKTVNKGIELCPNNNVILLNSDARVTPRWYEGMLDAASTDTNIATVTAMSDRAGAFSAPKIGNDNELPVGVTEEEYATAFRRFSAALYPTVPTGNGFCMFIRRTCIDHIGQLDEEAFPRGYGEENDFCMRARESGWRNIIDDRTYVFHDRSKSFGGEKASLIKEGRKVIDERYPDYGKAIRFYSNSSTMNMIRYCSKVALEQVLNNSILPRVLYVISTLTGGTPQTNRDLMMSLNDIIEPWLLHCDSKTLTLYKVGVEKDEIIERYILNEVVEPYTHKSFEYDKVIRSWACKYDFEMAHIRHLAWHSLNLPKMLKKSGSKVLMSFHDYYAASPSVKLIDPYNDPEKEHHKLTPLWAEYETPANRKAWESKWRSMFTEALSYCDAYVTTSESAKETILNYIDLDDSKPFEVINHGRDFKNFNSPSFNNKPADIIKILVPGNIDKNKGLDVVYELLEYDEHNQIEFHILGDAPDIIANDKIILHGSYERDDFQELVKGIDPHLAAIFSVWNETWCHTLTESLASGIPAVVFNFGTLRDRINKTQSGWIAEKGDIKKLYNRITNEFIQTEEYEQKIENVKKWQEGIGAFNTNRYMSVQYLNLYKNIINNFENRLDDIWGVVVPSSANLKSANGSSHVRIWQKTENSLYRDKSYLRLLPEQLILGLIAGKVNKAIIQRNVLTLEHWQKIKPFVLSGSFKYIYEIDDDLLNVPQDKDPDRYYESYKNILEDILRHSYLITVSTELLKDKYKQYNSNIKVIPNTLNIKYWLSSISTNNDRLRTGSKLLYFGSYTHQQDLESILPQLDKVHSEHPEFRLKLIGVTEGNVDRSWIEKVEVPDNCKNYPNFIKFLQQHSKECVAGIAPLARDKFNDFKSDLKVKEYLGLGIPVFAQNSKTYQNTGNLKSVKLVEYDEWKDLIIEFLENKYINSISSDDAKIYFNEAIFDLIMNIK